MIAKIIRPYTLTEEIWHAAIHGVGVALGIAALVILVVLSAIYGNVWSVVSCAIFGASLILMYSASTVYHAFSKEKVKKILKKFDHIAIYYLIAGTYTPFLLVPLRGPVGWTLFGIVWGCALLGTVLKLCTSGSGTKLWSIGLYLIMGWMIVFASRSLVRAIPSTALTFLILGGLFYTIGIAFYLWKKKKYTHVVWHFFVLLGSIMHFFAVLFSCVWV